MPAKLPEIPAFDELGFEQALVSVHDQVAAAYQRLQASPRDAEANGKLGMLLSVYRRDQGAAVFFERARTLAPAEFRWAYYHGMVLAQLGRHHDAAAAFDAALAIDPNYLEARYQLANVLLEINDLEQSIAHGRIITESHPGRIEGWLVLGRALTRKGEWQEAAEALQQARRHGPQYGEVHYALATVLKALGDTEGAAQEFAAYERTAANKLTVFDPLVQAVFALNMSDGRYMAVADAHLRNGQLQEAVIAFRQAVTVNPANGDAWSGLVNTLARLARLDEARSVYEEALAAGISYARLHLVWGSALNHHGEMTAAREVLAKAIALDPHYVEARQAMADLELQAGRASQAVEHLRAAEIARPNDPNVSLALAGALNAAGNHDEAAQRLEARVQQADADEAVVRKELALAYRGLGRQREALLTLQQALVAATRAADFAAVADIENLQESWQRSRPE